MTTKVQRWGNSLALRIPKSFAKDIHLEKGAVVKLSIYEGRLVIEPSSKSKYSLSGLLKNISEVNLHAEVDMGGSQGREIW
jgi:antitoxin MazE